MALTSISLPDDFFIMGYYLKLMHEYFNYPFFICHTLWCIYILLRAKQKTPMAQGPLLMSDG